MFLYNGNFINEELTFKEQANEDDNKRSEMNILAYEVDNNTIIKENKIKSKHIICPECKENVLMNISDYKIQLFNCKNNHIIDKIKFKDFEETQFIDVSKINCEKCNNDFINNIYNNEFYFCIKCNLTLCPLCKINHEKEHKIINFEDKNYICYKHDEHFTKYCEECKLNICIQCEKDHKCHRSIYYGDLYIEEDKNDELKDYIDKLNNDINEIITKLNKLKDFNC